MPGCCERQMDDASLLAELVAIPSPSGNEEAVAARLEEHMRKLGYRVRRDVAGNVVGEVGEPGAERTILLLGHMDTVPGHIPVRWEGGCLYGRGAVDAKGPLAALVLAAAQVAPHLKRTRLVVAGAVQEEAHSAGARYLAGTLAAPDFAIVGEPGGWQGITIGYKGVVTARYRVEGEVGHSASGVPTAAERAVFFWNALSALATAYNRDKQRRFDKLDPSLRSINSATDGLRERATLTVSVRIPPAMPVETVKSAMEGWGRGSALEFPYAEPVFVANRNNPLVRAFLRAIRAAGGCPRFKLKTGTSDMNIIGAAWGCPVVAYGPGDSALDHTPHEHVDLAEFRRAVAALSTVLNELESQ